MLPGASRALEAVTHTRELGQGSEIPWALAVSLGTLGLPGAPLGCERRFGQSCLGLEGWGPEGTAGLHCCYCRCRAFRMLPGEDGSS